MGRGAAERDPKGLLLASWDEARGRVYGCRGGVGECWSMTRNDMGADLWVVRPQVIHPGHILDGGRGGDSRTV